MFRNYGSSYGGNRSLLIALKYGQPLTEPRTARSAHGCGPQSEVKTPDAAHALVFLSCALAGVYRFRCFFPVSSTGGMWNTCVFAKWVYVPCFAATVRRASDGSRCHVPAINSPQSLTPAGAIQATRRLNAAAWRGGAGRPARGSGRIFHFQRRGDSQRDHPEDGAGRNRNRTCHVNRHRSLTGAHRQP